LFKRKGVSEEMISNAENTFFAVRFE